MAFYLLGGELMLKKLLSKVKKNNFDTL